MKIIALDSSGLVASVAIVEDDVLLAEYNVQYKKTHSQTLLPMLDELKKMIDLDLNEIDAIVIAKGPGSFTGLRIGSSTAKGLAYGLNIPIIEIGTLEGMACNMYGNQAIICPMMDARRNQVYSGVFTYELKNDQYEMRTLKEECAVSVEEMIESVNSIANELNKTVIFLGDGVPVYEEIIKNKINCSYSFAPAHLNRQRASAFAKIAMDKLVKGEGVSSFEHAPVYLRLSQAERERNEGIRNKGSNY